MLGIWRIVHQYFGREPLFQRNRKVWRVFWLHVYYGVPKAIVVPLGIERVMTLTFEHLTDIGEFVNTFVRALNDRANQTAYDALEAIYVFFFFL